MHKALEVALIFFTISLLPAAASAEIQRGKTLVEQNCIACHASRFGNNGSDIYTRKNHRVNSLDALQRQVNRCKNNLGLTWFDDEVNDVVDYLNKNYYKFK